MPFVKDQRREQLERTCETRGGKKKLAKKLKVVGRGGTTGHTYRDRQEALRGIKKDHGKRPKLRWEKNKLAIIIRKGKEWGENIILKKGGVGVKNCD